jgi:flagellar hook protein FlgE
MIASAINSMRAHTIWMQSSANNVANINTGHFGAGRTVIENGPKAVVEQTGKATDLGKEMTDQVVLSDGFEAQVAAIRTEDEMLGTLLDIRS